MSSFHKLSGRHQDYIFVNFIPKKNYYNSKIPAKQKKYNGNNLVEIAEGSLVSAEYYPNTV